MYGLIIPKTEIVYCTFWSTSSNYYSGILLSLQCCCACTVCCVVLDWHFVASMETLLPSSSKVFLANVTGTKTKKKRKRCWVTAHRCAKNRNKLPCWDTDMETSAALRSTPNFAHHREPHPIPYITAIWNWGMVLSVLCRNFCGNIGVYIMADVFAYCVHIREVLSCG